MTFQAPIGSSLPRDRAKRLLAGSGRYIDDIALPRMLHPARVRAYWSWQRTLSDVHIVKLLRGWSLFEAWGRSRTAMKFYRIIFGLPEEIYRFRKLQRLLLRILRKLMTGFAARGYVQGLTQRGPGRLWYPLHWVGTAIAGLSVMTTVDCQWVTQHGMLSFREMESITWRMRGFSTW